MTSYRLSVSLGLLLLAEALLAAPSVNAQRPHHISSTPAQLLAAFVRAHETSEPNAGYDLTRVLGDHTNYPAGDVESLLRGLEQLALKGASSRLRAEAALNVALPGSRRSARPIPGILGRLQGIYHSSSDRLVRSVIVAAMAEQAERPQALAFLERLAVQERGDFPGSASQALGTLVAMDEEGRTVLRRLHKTGSVRDPKARSELTVMASRGYRLK
jgi:hypothetical protein